MKPFRRFPISVRARQIPDERRARRESALPRTVRRALQPPAVSCYRADPVLQRSYVPVERAWPFLTGTYRVEFFS